MSNEVGAEAYCPHCGRRVVIIYDEPKVQPPCDPPRINTAGGDAARGQACPRIERIAGRTAKMPEKL